MGTRDYKKWAPGEYYHIYNRGNGKQDVFLDNQDYKFFLFRLRQNLFPKEDDIFRTPPLPVNSFSVISYCLMPNHFHFLIRQNSDIPISKLVSRICTSYSKYFNKKYEKIGHVFQDKFKQSTIDDNKYLIWLTAYIHQNPKIARIVNDLVQYPWSSYPEYLDIKLSTLCETKIIIDQFDTIEAFKDFTEKSFSIIKLRKEAESLLLDT